MTADTAVRIASISKVVEGMAAMKLAQDGVLDLDAPLSSYWGEHSQNPYSLRQPSPRSLMTHSSTLKDLEMTRGLDRLTSILSRTSSWRDREPDRADSWAYSNFGMSIFGTTLELACGQLLDDYLQAQFFAPLDIHASFHAARLSPEQLANLYEPKGVLCRSIQTQISQPVPTEIGMGATYYAGGLTISSLDMAKLLAVLCGDGTYQGPSIFSPRWWQLWRRPNSPYPTENIPPSSSAWYCAVRTACGASPNCATTQAADMGSTPSCPTTRKPETAWWSSPSVPTGMSMNMVCTPCALT